MSVYVVVGGWNVGLYKNFNAAAMRYKNKGKPKDITKDCVIL